MRIEGAPSFTCFHCPPCSLLIKPITSKHLLCRCKFFIRDKIHNIWATKFNLTKLNTSRYSKEMQLFIQTINQLSLICSCKYCLQSYLRTQSYMYLYHLLRLCSKKNTPFHDFSIFGKELCIWIYPLTLLERGDTALRPKGAKKWYWSTKSWNSAVQILKIVYVRWEPTHDSDKPWRFTQSNVFHAFLLGNDQQQTL